MHSIATRLGARRRDRAKQVLLRRTGQTLAYVLAIYVLLFLIGLPLIDFCTLGLRSQALFMAAHDSAFNASKCKSFLVDISSSEQAAKTVAESSALRAASLMNGTTIDSVVTSILVTNINSLATTRQTAPLSQPADTSQYVYQIEVVVTGRVKPLLMFSRNIFGDIPGLTQELKLAVRACENCESTQGLTM
ncbi:MAG: hypothetical protein C0469_05645 [Cyanobacteria bacterium DS2.3.42]|nr:hypothetical protein [Cyanobacteria bacterium DS2.3.42]